MNVKIFEIARNVEYKHSQEIASKLVEQSHKLYKVQLPKNKTSFHYFKRTFTICFLISVRFLIL
jgi:hypothetical protein